MNHFGRPAPTSALPGPVSGQGRNHRGRRRGADGVLHHLAIPDRPGDRRRAERRRPERAGSAGRGRSWGSCSCGPSSTSCGGSCRAGSAWGSSSTCGGSCSPTSSGMSLSYFDRMPVGQLMSRATSDLQTVRFFLGYGLIFIFMQAFTLIIVTGLMLWLNWSLALLALLMGPGAARWWPGATAAAPTRPHRRAAAGGRGHRDGRGERGRHPGDQGLRPRGRPHRALRRARARRAFDRSMDAARLAASTSR